MRFGTHIYRGKGLLAVGKSLKTRTLRDDPSGVTQANLIVTLSRLASFPMVRNKYSRICSVG
jgi:hypothetical protein